MDYEDSEGDEAKAAARGGEGGREGLESRDREEELPKYRNRLSQYDTLSCGYAADGSVRRLPKSLLRYSKEKLLDLLDEIFNPRPNKRRSPMAFKYH